MMARSDAPNSSSVIVFHTCQAWEKHGTTGSGVQKSTMTRPTQQRESVNIAGPAGTTLARGATFDSESPEMTTVPQTTTAAKITITQQEECHLQAQDRQPSKVIAQMTC